MLKIIIWLCFDDYHIVAYRHLCVYFLFNTHCNLILQASGNFVNLWQKEKEGITKNKLSCFNEIHESGWRFFKKKIKTPLFHAMEAKKNCLWKSKGLQLNLIRYSLPSSGTWSFQTVRKIELNAHAIGKVQNIPILAIAIYRGQVFVFWEEQTSVEHTTFVKNQE